VPLSLTVLAGIIAKGFGVIAGIFGFGVLLGVLITVMIGSRLRRLRR
jgi:hypothetical protein